MLELRAESGAGSSSINIGFASVPTTIESHKAILDYSRDRIGVEQWTEVIHLSIHMNKWRAMVVIILLRGGLIIYPLVKLTPLESRASSQLLLRSSWESRYS
jgi:hypothetical protein